MTHTHHEHRPVRVTPIDGALLAFDTRSGDRWLLRSDATRAMRSEAPPLVLFSITNACNLACSFCYRDERRDSEWTVETAFDLLSELASRGTLEVAFGGGEPFVFKGFATLVERLREETPIVVHATSNGAAITRETARRLRGRFGELRLSIYDDAPWRERFAMLTDEGHSVGLHYLVTPARLKGLRSFVEELAAIGARKLFLLSYNGSDRALHLSREESDELAHTINSLRDLTIEVGVSACWGSRLEAVPKLSPDRVDCGAGSHFVSIGPDATVSPCSFHHQRREARTARAVIDAWKAMQHAGPARIAGCHREQRARSSADGLWRWRAWSGNNSVDCFTVGRFATSATAKAAIDELRAVIETPEPDLVRDASVGYDTEVQRVVRAERDPQRRRERIAEVIEERERWLAEVSTWERDPTPLQSYVQSLGVAESTLSLPRFVERPELLASFGTVALHLQGTTLAPFRALDSLWVYRGGRVYDLPRGSSWNLAMLWAARCNDERDAYRHASQLNAVVRGASIWGIADILGRLTASRPGPSIEWLATELEDRGLAFDGVVMADRSITIDDVERAIGTLPGEPLAVPTHLWFEGADETAESVLRAIRELDANPSVLSEWAGRRPEGSRRWPRELRTHRWGRMTLIEAERLPFVVGRGLVVRGANTPYSVDARELRATVAFYNNDAPARARTTLTGLGLDLVNADDPTDMRGFIVGDAVATRMDRIAPALERKNVPWEAMVEPRDALQSALEYLQTRLKIRFE